MDFNEDRVRERAYALWEEAGRPEGKDVEHWHQAEHELADNAATAQGTDSVSGNGLASNLQRGGTMPGRSPGAGVGSIGTGGGSTDNEATGTVGR